MSKIEAFYAEQREVSQKISLHKIYHKKCLECDARDICDGFYVDFIEEFGASAISPIKLGARANDAKFYTQNQWKIIEAQEWDWFFTPHEREYIHV